MSTPSYKERSQLIKALSEKQYQDARLKKDESESVRIGDRDGTTGRYEVLHQDGGITRNGIKTFNQAAPQDGFVRLIGSGNGGIALDHRNRREVVRPRVTEERTEGLVKILLLKDNKIYIGGDRSAPEEIYTIPTGYGVVNSKITNTGRDTGDWNVSLVLRKQTVIDAYANRATFNFLRFYLENQSEFFNSMIVVSIIDGIPTEVQSDGIIKQSSTSTFTYTKSQFIQFASDTLGTLNFFVRETYNLSIGSDINQTIASRTCDITLNLDSEEGKVLSLSMRAILLAAPLPVIYWNQLSDTGLSSTYDDAVFNPVVSSIRKTPSDGGWILLNPLLAGNGWIYSFDMVALASSVERSGIRSGVYEWKPNLSVSGLPYYTDIIDTSIPPSATFNYQGKYYGSLFSGENSSLLAVSNIALQSLPPVYWTFTANSSTDVITLVDQVHPTEDAAITGTTPLRMANESTLPSPLAINTTYYPVDISGSTCKLALTVGGAAINITSAGTGAHKIFVFESITTPLPITGETDIDVVNNSNINLSKDYTLSNYLDQSNPVEPRLGFITQSNTELSLQGNSQLVKTNDGYTLYTDDEPLTVLSPSTITAVWNLVDDTASRVLPFFTDEITAVSVQAVQLIEESQDPPDTKTIAIQSIFDGGTPLDASAFLSIDEFKSLT